MSAYDFMPCVAGEKEIYFSDSHIDPAKRKILVRNSLSWRLVPFFFVSLFYSRVSFMRAIILTPSLG